MTGDKPIALVCAQFRHGLEWAQRHLDIDEYNNQSRRILDFMGQEYYVVTHDDQAKGFEFSGMHIIHVSGYPLNERLINEVKTRVR